MREILNALYVYIEWIKNLIRLTCITKANNIRRSLWCRGFPNNLYIISIEIRRFCLRRRRENQDALYNYAQRTIFHHFNKTPFVLCLHGCACILIRRIVARRKLLFVSKIMNLSNVGRVESRATHLRNLSHNLKTCEFLRNFFPAQNCVFVLDN